MINQTSNKLICLEQFKWQYGTQDLEVDKVDERLMKLVKTKMQITITPDNYMKYYYDGIILRNELILDTSQNPEILKNVEQMKYLRWKGEYGENMRKQGKWMVTWNGVALIGVGGYFQNGLKEGLWKQLLNNYWDQAQVYESGQYIQNQKRGMWNYFYKKNKIGGGSYNQLGQKNGKWVELSDGFQDHSQVTYKGEYQNGKKVGKWDTFFEIKQIGGGLYDELSNGNKIGTWIELDDGFCKDQQIIYSGEYKNGKKFGKWDIEYNGYSIGGGSFDELGQGIKIGSWFELIDGFDESSQVIYYGEYKDGKRVGRWNFEERGDQIDGGIYDNHGDKIGQWVDLSDGFRGGSQITYTGRYKKGKKVGRWDINFNEGENDKIGGGSYDKVGNGNKIGKWIDVSEKFAFEEEITFQGEYKNGKKIGKWDILDNDTSIGGGSYDEEGNQIKIGKWVELSDGFYQPTQLTYYGEYRNGQKIGRWDILQIDIVIGGGTYDDKGDKNGLWIDLNQGYKSDQEIIYQGQYKNSIKIGKWDILQRNWSDEFILIGGGSYDEEGDGIKIGRWTELSNEFKRGQEVIYTGDYHNGKKVGRWDILFGMTLNDTKQLSGGGSYDAGGDEIKIGKWIELSQEFNSRQTIIQIGEYSNGKKVGKWVETIQSDRDSTNEEKIYDN